VSEYQYYEFLAVDRPLSKAEVAQVRALSTRADITATRFVNEYHWGNFRGDATKLVEELYDAHLYFANWGSRRLLLRLPAAVLPAKTASVYALDESLSVRTRKGHTLLDFCPESDDGGEADWEAMASWTLSVFIGLRAELAAGDLRPLYLAWLAGLGVWELADDDEEEYAREVEPPVPAGLGTLTGAQQALAEFLRVDPDLLSVAAQASAAETEPRVDRKRLASFIAELPAAEKDTLLFNAAMGSEPRPGAQLLARYREAATGYQDTAPEVRRNAAHLLDAAHARRTGRLERERAAREADERRRVEAAEASRDDRLDHLARNAEQTWGTVEDLIARKNSSAYDRASVLLDDLRAAHARTGDTTAFEERAGRLREAHRGKPALMRRFDEIGIPHPRERPARK
jgi:hypothetical protein